MNQRPAARLVRWSGLAGLALLAFALTRLHFDISGAWYGLYLIRQAELSSELEVTDDLLLGEGERVIAAISFSRIRSIANADKRQRHVGTYLEAEWDKGLGRGLVRNHLPDGTELVTLLSRFDNGPGDGGTRRGVFVGGSLPDVANEIGRQNQSGMAFRDRAGLWRHVWCNANEAMLDLVENRVLVTSGYTFLGSRVLVNDPNRFVVESSHRVTIGGVPLRMQRVAYFTAGKPYFELGITLENVGAGPARYSLMYGDEPWVGQFGSSAGSLGWTDGLVFSDESAIDPHRHRAAGIVDTRTGTANFLAWLDENRPDFVYVSNEMGVLNPSVPLASNQIFIGTQWQERVIAPGEVHRIRLAIGMAGRDAVSGQLQVPDGVFAGEEAR